MISAIALNNPLASIIAMDDKEIQRRIKQGAILTQVTFEVLGSPKEHVDKTIREFVDNIRKDKQITILTEDYGEAEETKEGGLWSTYADTEMLFHDLEKFVWLCINFMPASIEIISPAELKFRDKDLTLWLNDLMAKLHEISATVRQATVKEDLFVKNMNAMIQNCVLLAAEHNHSPEQISGKIGIPVEQLHPFFEALVKAKKLEMKGDEYHRKF